jgi:hypothetical protein
MLSWIPTELRPIVNHCLAVVTLIGSLLIIGEAVHLLQLRLPNHDYSWIELVDILAAMVLMSMFVTFAICIVAVRLYYAFLDELRRPAPVLESQPLEPKR